MGTLALKTARKGSPRSLSGPTRIYAATMTFAAYIAGGASANLPALFPGMATKIRVVWVEPQGGYVFSWNPATKKIVAFEDGGAGALIEVTAGTDLSGLGPVPIVALAVGEKEDEFRAS